MGIEHPSSYYCSTRCMTHCWPTHKVFHQTTKDLSINIDDNDESRECIVTNEWKVKNSKESVEFVQDLSTLSSKFPPPIINKWEKIPSLPPNTKRYKPTQSDIGRQLLLECTPTIKPLDDEKDKMKKDKM